jgi:hypothetical protein
MQMRLEAEHRGRPQSKPEPLGKADPSQHLPMHSETPLEADATADWLAHIAAGRITVR